MHNASMNNLSKMAHINGYFPPMTRMLFPLAFSVGIWGVVPALMRRLHTYTEDSASILKHPGSILKSGRKEEQRVPFGLSVWSAMEDPCRMCAAFLFLSQLGGLVAPTTFAEGYVTRIWSGGSFACLLWFLHRWKGNVMIRFVNNRDIPQNEKDRYLALDHISSLILLFVGGLGLAEASGVAIQSLLTVGGIGGVATAFAARDVLGNILSGISLIFSKPFNTGDYIKAGNVEGKVQEVGLHTTRLLNGDKNPVLVPNSFFSSEVIVNMSRAQWQKLTLKIPVRLQDFTKVEKITVQVRNYLNSHPVVFMGEDKPRCSVSQFAATAIEILITCNVKPKSAEEYFQTEQDILLETAKIVTNCGAVLGGML